MHDGALFMKPVSSLDDLTKTGWWPAKAIETSCHTPVDL